MDGFNVFSTVISVLFVPATVLILFALSGLFIAAEDALESALAGEMVGEEARGLGFGALAAVNGVGDLVSSVMIGFIWTFIGYSTGFEIAAILAAAGTILLVWTTRAATRPVQIALGGSE